MRVIWIWNDKQVDFYECHNKQDAKNMLVQIMSNPLIIKAWIEE